MAQAATMDMLSIKVNLGGKDINDLGPGQAIRISKGRASTEAIEGIKGLIAFTKQRNKLGTLEVDLIMTGDDNDVLQRFLTAQQETEGGIIFKATVTDISGRFEWSSNASVVAGDPSVSIGEGGSVNTWSILGVWDKANTLGRGPTPLVAFADLPELPDIETIIPPVGNI